MLKALALVDGSLYRRIDEAASKGLLTPDMAEWAHDVRLDANDQRHADVAAIAPDFEHAKRCLEFAKALADILFVLPARVTRGKTSAHKAAQKASVQENRRVRGCPHLRFPKRRPPLATARSWKKASFAMFPAHAPFSCVRT